MMNIMDTIGALDNKLKEYGVGDDAEEFLDKITKVGTGKMVAAIDAGGMPKLTRFPF